MVLACGRGWLRDRVVVESGWVGGLWTIESAQVTWWSSSYNVRGFHWWMEALQVLALVDIGQNTHPPRLRQQPFHSHTLSLIHTHTRTHIHTRHSYHMAPPPDQAHGFRHKLAMCYLDETECSGRWRIRQQKTGDAKMNIYNDCCCCRKRIILKKRLNIY